MSIMNLYSIDFTDEEWEEILSMTFEPFDLSSLGDSLTRGQWFAIGDMALGKAVRIRRGDYNMGDDEDVDMPAWAATLERIADKIFTKFRPGDGQI